MFTKHFLRHIFLYALFKRQKYPRAKVAKTKLAILLYYYPVSGRSTFYSRDIRFIVKPFSFLNNYSQKSRVLSLYAEMEFYSPPPPPPTRLLSAKSPWYLRIERQILTILQLYLTKNLLSIYLAKMLKSLCIGSRWMSIEGRQELFCIPVYHGWFVIRRKQDLDKKVSVVKSLYSILRMTNRSSSREKRNQGNSGRFVCYKHDLLMFSYASGAVYYFFEMLE